MVSDWTKDFDMIDFFAVLIAVSMKTPLSGLYAGVFSVFVMMFSRILGPDEGLWITLTESVAFFFAALFSPYVFHFTNGNLLYTLFIFTAQRYIYDIIIVYIFFRPMIYLAILSLFFGVPIAYLMNKLMVTFLSPFFSTVFDTGLRFNFPLFSFALILTVCVHYLDKYFSGPIGKVPDKSIFNFSFKIPRTKKLHEKTGTVAEDNYNNYPAFFEHR